MRRLLIACLILTAGLALGQDVFRRNFYGTENQVGIEVEDEQTFTNAVVKYPFNYDFDAGTNYLDASAAVNDGTQATANSRPSFVADDGTTSAHYDFDGTDDYVRSSAVQSNDFPASFTAMAWVNSDAASTFQVAVGNQESAFPDDNRSFELRVTAANFLSLGIIDSSGTFASVTGTTTVNTGQWTHVAGVYDDAGNTKEVFINGVSDGSSAQASIRTADSSTEIGRREVTANFHWNGQIDDVRIYGRALTSAEILDIYNATSGAHP